MSVCFVFQSALEDTTSMVMQTAARHTSAADNGSEFWDRPNSWRKTQLTLGPGPCKDPVRGSTNLTSELITHDPLSPILSDNGCCRHDEGCGWMGKIIMERRSGTRCRKFGQWHIEHSRRRWPNRGRHRSMLVHRSRRPLKQLPDKAAEEQWVREQGDHHESEQRHRDPSEEHHDEMSKESAHVSPRAEHRHKCGGECPCRLTGQPRPGKRPSGPSQARGLRVQENIVTPLFVLSTLSRSRTAPFPTVKFGDWSQLKWLKRPRMQGRQIH